VSSIFANPTPPEDHEMEWARLIPGEMPELKQLGKRRENLPFPICSPTSARPVRAVGIIDPAEGVAQRATFIVDPDNMCM
jgi:peroxiredoxin